MFHECLTAIHSLLVFMQIDVINNALIFPKDTMASTAGKDRNSYNNLKENERTSLVTETLNSLMLCQWGSKYRLLHVKSLISFLFTSF